jgi:AcrR family transcriptional regulator
MPVSHNGDAAHSAPSASRDPRANQRERTRLAIMDGARKLLHEGKIPSVADAAEAARVSRATAYRYFPTQSALIQEAVNTDLPRTWESDKRHAELASFADRVECAVEEMLTVTHDNDTILRGVLLLSLQQWAAIQAGDKLEEEPITRGRGRIPAIQAVLAPYRGTLTPTASRRLSIALSLIVGAESLVVLRDIWGLEETEAKDVARWIARTLAQATADVPDPAVLPQLSRTYATGSLPPIAPR